MQNTKPVQHHAMLAALMALCITGNAAAAQRSLAQAISDSFEQSVTDPDAGVTAEPMPAPVPVVIEAQPMPVPMTAAPTEPTVAPAVARLQAEMGAAMESLDESLQQGLQKFHETVISPERLQPIPAADPAMSCNELYTETSRLVSLGERYRPAYAEDPRNIAIGAAGFVVTPAFYLYGVTAYASWYENGHRKTAKQRVTQLRRLMADRRCFSRD